MDNQKWPELPLNRWEETYDLLHMLTQIIGKIKIQYNPYKNHWWNVTFSPTVDGLTTRLIPFNDNCMEIKFNLQQHQIEFKTEDGKNRNIELISGTVADYYSKIERVTKELGMDINIWKVPVEVEDRTPFDKDTRNRKYDPEFAEKFRIVLINSARVLEKFRSRFTGKASPVHFFWGSFDIAVTFFNGNDAPEHPGAPNVSKDVMVKSYNQELMSFGFWPGKGLGEPAYYAYSYPVIEGMADHSIQPEEAYFSKDLGEFLLPYKAVANAENAEEKLYLFFNSAYEPAEKEANWDKKLMQNV